MKNKNAFTLVELLIVVSILGILAALALPEFSNASTKAKEAAAKESLQMLRQQIELYAAQHKNAPPGYINGQVGPNGTFIVQLIYCTNINGEINFDKTPTELYPYGPYISDFPKNPFNGFVMVLDFPDDAELPEAATGQYGWIYKASHKELRLDWPGTDSIGEPYYNY